MADFFSNLLLRSNTPTSGTILQPRLPSLFESHHGVDELPAPQADQTHRDVSMPDPIPAHIEQAGLAAPLPGRRTDGKKPSPERQSRAAFEHNSVMASPERDPGMEIASPTMENLSVQGLPEPERTISARNQHQETVFGVESAVETETAPLLQENGKSLQRGTRLVNELTVRSAAENHPVRRALSARNNIQLPISRQSAAQTEQVAQNESVVQVHIGRIEVRAITPLAPSQPVRNSPAVKAGLSLEDYLRQREEKR